MKIQVAIAFNEARKLSEEQIIKLIKLQARKLRFTEWETNYLCEMCIHKKCVEKGFGAVFEFAGYVDRICDLSVRRSKILADLRHFCTSYSTVPQNPEEFIVALKRLAETNAKLLHCICQFRKLNWNPRPIFGDVDEANPLASIFPEGNFENTKICLQTVLRDEAYDLLGFAQENDIDLTSCNIIPSLAIILAPVLDSNEFASVIARSLSADAHLPGRSAEAMNLVESAHGPTLQIFRGLRVILSHEDRIEQTWVKFERGTDKHGNVVEAVEEVVYRHPILRIPYSGIACSCQSLKWFTRTQNDYKSSMALLATGLKNSMFSVNSSESMVFKYGTLPKFKDDTSKRVSRPKPVAAMETSSQQQAFDDDPSRRNSEFASAPTFAIDSDNTVKEFLGEVLKRRETKPAYQGNNTQQQSAPQHTNGGGKQPLADINNNNSAYLTSAPVQKMATTPVTSDDSPTTTPPRQLDQFDTSAVNLSTKSPIRGTVNLEDQMDSLHVETNASFLKSSFDFKETGAEGQQRSVVRPEQLLFLQQQQMAQQQFQLIYGYSPYDNNKVSGGGGTNSCLDNIVQRGVAVTDTIFSSRSNYHDIPIDSPDDISKSEGDLNWGSSPVSTGRRTNQRVASAGGNSSSTMPSNRQRSANNNNNNVTPLRPRSSSDHSGSRSNRSSGRVASAHANYRHSGFSGGKHLEALELLTVLANPMHRGECLADSQVVRFAFQYIEESGGGLRIVQLAARKIKVWWRIVYPRRKLRVHHLLCSTVRELVFEAADKAVMESIVKHRRRIKMLRYGSAVKIQKQYRQHRFNIALKEKLAEALARARATDVNIKRWVRTTMLLLQIYRFIRRWNRKFVARARRLQQPGQARKMLTFATFGDNFLIKLRECRLKAALSFISSNNSAVLTRQNVRVQMVKEREKAAKKVQGLARNILARGSKKRREFEREMMHKIKSVLYKVVYLYRREKKRLRNVAAVQMQKVARGFLCRARIHREVRSGMLLNKAWRRHKAAKTLRHNLRRVERPVKIVLHGLRHINQGLLHNEDVRVKISVWWHPLLHIVSESDFATIISHKHPQFVTYSKIYSPSQEVDRTEPELGHPSLAHHRLSTLVTNLFSTQGSAATAPSPTAGSSSSSAPLSLERAANLISKFAIRRRQTMAKNKEGGGGDDSSSTDGGANAGAGADSEDENNKGMPPRRFRGLATKMLAVHKVQTPLNDKKRTPTPIPTNSIQQPFKFPSLKDTSSSSAPVDQDSDKYLESESAALVAATAAADEAMAKQRKFADLASKMMIQSPPVPGERKRQVTPFPTELARPGSPSTTSTAPVPVPVLQQAATLPVLSLTDDEADAPSNRSKSPLLRNIVSQLSNRDNNRTESDPPPASSTSPGNGAGAVSSLDSLVVSPPRRKKETFIHHQRGGSLPSLAISAPVDVAASSTAMGNSSETTARVRANSVQFRKRTSVSLGSDPDTRLIEDQVLMQVLEVTEQEEAGGGPASLLRQESMNRRESIKKSSRRSGSFMRGRLGSFLAKTARTAAAAAAVVVPEEDDENDNENASDNDEGEAEDAFDMDAFDTDNNNGTGQSDGAFSKRNSFVRRRASSILGSFAAVFGGSRRSSNAGAGAGSESRRQSIANENDDNNAAANATAASPAPVVDDDNKFFKTGRVANEPETDVAPEPSPKERRTTRKSSRQSAIASSAGANGNSRRTSKRLSIITSVSKAIGRMSGVRTSANMPKGRRQQSRCPKMFCHFEDEVIRIPGCHGNSVFRFDFLAGDRRFGSQLFFMSKHDGPLFWGGEYTKDIFLTQARRVVQLKSKLIGHTASNKPEMEPPVFEFKLCSGAALKSRAQWAKLMVKGNGPVQRAMTRNRFFSLFTFLSPWHRAYLSLDEDGLSIYESKSSTEPLAYVRCRDITSLSVEQGLPTHNIGDSKSNAFAEDLFNLVLVTTHGDSLFIRLHDCNSRVGWNFAMENILSIIRESVVTSKQTSVTITRHMTSQSIEAFSNRIHALFGRPRVLPIENSASSSAAAAAAAAAAAPPGAGASTGATPAPEDDNKIDGQQNTPTPPPSTTTISNTSANATATRPSFLSRLSNSMGSVSSMTTTSGSPGGRNTPSPSVAPTPRSSILSIGSRVSFASSSGGGRPSDATSNSNQGLPSSNNTGGGALVDTASMKLATLNEDSEEEGDGSQSDDGDDDEMNSASSAT